MLYIDPSELRSNSKFLKLLETKPDLEWEALDGLEALTGADIMISPISAPYPGTETLLKIHIKRGALLVQQKFDLDFVSSVIDGRYKEAQSRMKLVGAAPWQRVCAIIGLLYQNENGDICSHGRTAGFVIGGMANNFKFEHLLKAKSMWSMRGGILAEVSSNDYLAWIEVQQSVLEAVIDTPQRNIWPKSPALYEEEIEQFDNEDWINKEWQAAQELTLINDWRKVLMTLPGVGEKKAKEIGENYNNWVEFETALNKGGINIKGIGPKTMQNIVDFLENKE